jgi:formylglycine-generating enzyme required for sulfatase activity
LRRAAFACIALAAAAMSCSLALGVGELPLPSGAAVTPAQDGAAVTDAAVTDAAVTDAGASEDAPSDAPPAVVSVLDGSFAIDAVEVTNGAYKQFLAAVSTGAFDAGALAHPSCGWNMTYVKSVSCGGASALDAPVSCVDWCDAWAYCAWAGKRLCGAILGGPVGPGVRTDPTKSEWVQACGGSDPQLYPYGTMGAAGACATKENVSAAVAVRSFQGCQGLPRGLFDMVGNVSEWDDSCATDAGTDAGPDQDECASRGGSFSDGVTTATCTFSTTHARAAQLPTLGFRCCSR